MRKITLSLLSFASVTTAFSAVVRYHGVGVIDTSPYPDEISPGDRFHFTVAIDESVPVESYGVELFSEDAIVGFSISADSNNIGSYAGGMTIDPSWVGVHGGRYLTFSNTAGPDYLNPNGDLGSFGGIPVWLITISLADTTGNYAPNQTAPSLREFYGENYPPDISLFDSTYFLIRAYEESSSFEAIGYVESFAIPEPSQPFLLMSSLLLVNFRRRK